MGSSHMAHCKCGFEEEITVGGGRHNFHKVSLFPHYCANCGLVQANIAKTEAKGIVPPCPKCGNNDLHEYGTKTVCVPVAGNAVAIDWGTYHAMEQGNLCPACRQMTLVFDRMPSVLFD